MQPHSQSSVENIIITGTTSGIGFELAKLYKVKNNTKLILLGRKPLEQLDGGLFNDENYCQMDLASSNCVEIVLDFLERIGINHLNLFIHNAGTGYFGSIEKQTDESIIQILQVNLYAALKLSHTLFPLLEKSKGKIVLISSVASYLPTPDYAVYTASKAALDSFARSLRIEGNIRVQVIHPGPTNTGIFVKSGLPKEKVNLSKLPTAMQVAGRIKTRIETNDLNAIIGLSNKVLGFLGHYFAGILDSALLLYRKL